MISTAVLAAFLLLLRFVAPPLKPRFRIEERISTQALLNRIAFLRKACMTTESGYGVSTRAVKTEIKKNIKNLERDLISGDSVIPPNTIDILSAVYERLKDRTRLCLKQGHIGKYPRLFLLCDTIVKNTRGCVPPKLLKKTVDAFAPLTDDEKSELYDVLIFCEAGLVCTALEDYRKRRRDYISGAGDAESGRVDLDRLRNADYICGQYAASSEENVRGFCALADNNGIDADNAVRSGNVHMAETAEILSSAISTIEYALKKKSRAVLLPYTVPKKAELVLQVSAVVSAAATVVITAVLSDILFIAPIIISTGILYNAYVKLLRIFGINVGILPTVPDRYCAAMQGVLLIFSAVVFNSTVFVFSVSTVVCDTWVSIYFAGESASLAPLKSIPRKVKEFTAIPSRIVKLRSRAVTAIIQTVFSVTILTLNALFSGAAVLYIVGALALIEPLYDGAVRLIARTQSKLRSISASRKKERTAMPPRAFGNMTVGRNAKGKISVDRHGKVYELNYTLSSADGALSLSKSEGIALPHKYAYFIGSDKLEASAEVVAPPTHDCCVMRLSVVNRTPRSVGVDISVTCASEISDEFIGLYIDGETADVNTDRVKRVTKSINLRAFEKSTFISSLFFGKALLLETDVISSEGYFDTYAAAAQCCCGSSEGNATSLSSVSKCMPPRKNILCGENVYAEVSNSGVMRGTFPRAYVVLRDKFCPQKEWSPTVYPRGFGNRVLHYNGFSCFISDFNGIKSTLDIFAVIGSGALAYRLTVENRSSDDKNLCVSFVCELPSENKIGICYRADGAIVTVKNGDVFFISSTQKVEKSVYAENAASPTVGMDLNIKSGESKTVCFFLSRDRISIGSREAEKCFEYAAARYRDAPIRPLTTDKLLDYAFNRAFYRIVCEFDKTEKTGKTDDFTSLVLCRAYKYADINAVEKRLLSICSKPPTLLAPKCLALPLAVEDYMRYVDDDKILSEAGVAETISSAMERAYGYLCMRGMKESVVFSAFSYCAEEFRDCLSAEQRLRFGNIKAVRSESTLTMVIGLSAVESAYNAAKHFESGDFDGGYAMLSDMSKAILDFDGRTIDAAIFFLSVTENLFGIDRRGDSVRITPASSLGTPHMEFLLNDNTDRIHIVVADNGMHGGSWFTKIGNIVYATNAVTVADYPSPIILFRREPITKD